MSKPAQEAQQAQDWSIYRLGMEWLVLARSRVSEGHIRKVLRAVKSFDHFTQGKKVGKLSPLDMDKWIADNYFWAQNTKRTFRDSVMAVLNWSVKKKLLSQNPLRGCDGIAKTSRGSEAVITNDKHDKLYFEANPHMSLMLDALYNTGCRPKELCDAEAKHFREQDRILDISSEHKNAKKGKKRKIPLNDNMMKIIQDLSKKRWCPTSLAERAAAFYNDCSCSSTFSQTLDRLDATWTT